MVTRPIPLICMMCLGINLVLTCYANFPALQPEFEMMWALSKMESGLIFGIFFGGVLAGTPLLSPLADKYDPRRIWMFSATLMALSTFGFAFAGFRFAQRRNDSAGTQRLYGGNHGHLLDGRLRCRSCRAVCFRRRTRSFRGQKFDRLGIWICQRRTGCPGCTAGNAVYGAQRRSWDLKTRLLLHAANINSFVLMRLQNYSSYCREKLVRCLAY